jgi:hypothetical protein
MLDCKINNQEHRISHEIQPASQSSVDMSTKLTVVPKSGDGLKTMKSR